MSIRIKPYHDIKAIIYLTLHISCVTMYINTIVITDITSIICHQYSNTNYDTLTSIKLYKFVKDIKTS